ncbi:LOW QUALITY PROTEIN: hypothetical protein ACHAWF_007022 [Thalassiosira exigua]
MSSELVPNGTAAAAERVGSSSSSSPPASPGGGPRRSKLVLPALTAAVQQDLALSKGTSPRVRGGGGGGKRPGSHGGGGGSKPLSIGARPEFADYPLRDISMPHANDVLCGRGGGSNNHPGNESFRELVNEFPYVNCPKREKPLIARRIVEAVRNQTPPGRFLSKDSRTGLWNDIGDGKAREKTSQALREGAPILRDMISRPASPSAVAVVLKEAKKAERAEKECGVRTGSKQGRGSPAKSGRDDDYSRTSSDVHAQSAQASPLPPSHGVDLRLQRADSGGRGPPAVVFDGGHPPRRSLQKFRSFGEADATGGPVPGDYGRGPPTAWPPVFQHQPPPQPQPRRGFEAMPYPAQAHHGRHHMGGGGGFLPAHRGPLVDGGHGGQVSAHPHLLEYAGGVPPRYPPPADTVPLETVRGLLLGRVDPVQLALRVLSPEEAAVVARRHAGSRATAAPTHRPAASPSVHGVELGPAPTAAYPPPPRQPPLPLAPVVSDGSSSSSVGDVSPNTVRRRTPPPRRAGADDGSSVDSSSRPLPPSGGSEARRRRALPKKKRKYVEE